MTSRILRSLADFVIVAAVITAPRAAGAQGHTPRTPDRPAPPRPAEPAKAGRPDLQGTWNYSTLTPFERPTEFASKPFFTEQEAADFEKRTLQAQDVDANRQKTVRAQVNGTPETTDLASAYNQFWWDRGTKVASTRRTSIVIDPPDGKVPALTPQARNRQAAAAAARERLADGPEDRPLSERCILRPNAGPPMVPAGYNNFIQIVQTPGYVMIMSEQIHDARIIPVDGRPHLPSQIRPWMGDSRGRWEGDTLVVETTNFTDKTTFRGSGEKLKVVERFKRTSNNTLLYEFTIDDPESFAKPWTGQIPMTATQDLIYEYACHEANYGMEGTLKGARAVERRGEH